MRIPNSVGRIIGIMLVVQLAGLIVPFILLLPLTAGPSAFLSDAAGAALQIKTAVLLLLANCALTIGISLTAFQVIRQFSYAMALLLVSVGVIMFALQSVDNVHILSMLSLSQHYGNAVGPNEYFQALAATVGATRRWAHYSELIVIDIWIFLFFSVLFRFALVPRALAAFAMITVLLHFSGMVLPAFLGYGSVTLMGASMGAAQLVVAIWLMAKGFENHPETASSVHE